MLPPIQPIYLLAESHLLFWSPGGHPFVGSIRARLQTQLPRAAYIGASNGDDPAYYSIFEAAMDLAGIRDRRMISSRYTATDEAYLRRADVILLAGGDVARGRRVMDETGIAATLLERYTENATLLIGVSAGANLLGLKGWTCEDPDASQIFDGFQVVPHVIDAHDEVHHWSRLRKVISLPPRALSGVALPRGGGLIYHPDNTLEPVRRPVTEFIIRNDVVLQTLVYPRARDA
jgi:peptidase E